jgi:hypothetical protein
MATILIPTTGSSSISYQYDLDLAVYGSHSVYGYGYGYYQSVDGPPFDSDWYFDVFSIEGNLSGYGIGDYQYLGYLFNKPPYGNFSAGYGWGYEQTSFLAGNSLDVVTLAATVTQNGTIPIYPSGITVIFTGGPGVVLEKNVVKTDAFGVAYVNLRIDATVLKNIDEQGGSPKYISMASMGFITVEARIEMENKTGDWKYEVSMEARQLYGETSSEAISISAVGSSVLGV